MIIEELGPLTQQIYNTMQFREGPALRSWVCHLLLLVSSLAYTLILMKDTICFSETFLIFIRICGIMSQKNSSYSFLCESQIQQIVRFLIAGILLFHVLQKTPSPIAKVFLLICITIKNIGNEVRKCSDNLKSPHGHRVAEVGNYKVWRQDSFWWHKKFFSWLERYGRGRGGRQVCKRYGDSEQVNSLFYKVE
jgi:hypothetical protein